LIFIVFSFNFIDRNIVKAYCWHENMLVQQIVATLLRRKNFFKVYPLSVSSNACY